MSRVVKNFRRCRPRARWKSEAPWMIVLSTSKNAAAVGSAVGSSEDSTSGTARAASPASFERCWRSRRRGVAALLSEVTLAAYAPTTPPISLWETPRCDREPGGAVDSGGSAGAGPAGAGGVSWWSGHDLGRARRRGVPPRRGPGPFGTGRRQPGRARDLEPAGVRHRLSRRAPRPAGRSPGESALGDGRAAAHAHRQRRPDRR